MNDKARRAITNQAQGRNMELFAQHYFEEKGSHLEIINSDIDAELDGKYFIEIKSTHITYSRKQTEIRNKKKYQYHYPETQGRVKINKLIHEQLAKDIDPKTIWYMFIFIGKHAQIIGFLPYSEVTELLSKTEANTTINITRIMDRMILELPE